MEEGGRKRGEKESWRRTEECEQRELNGGKKKEKWKFSFVGCLVWKFRSHYKIQSNVVIIFCESFVVYFPFSNHKKEGKLSEKKAGGRQESILRLGR